MTDWPGSASTVQTWLREQLTDDTLVPGVTGLERARIDVSMAGADLAELVIDLTGVSVEIPRDTTESVTADPPIDTEPAVVSRTPAVARFSRLRAHPLTVFGARLTLDAEAHDVPFTWVRSAEGERGVAIDESSPDERRRGMITASMPRDDVVTLMRTVGNELQSQAGIRLTRSDIAFTQVSRDVVGVEVDAAVRRGLLSASVHATATIHVDRAGIVTLRRIRLRSWNPLIAIGLLIARRHVRRWEGRSIAVNDDLPPGVRIADAELDVTGDLTISARFV
jgi:hypothetical protein